MSAVERIEAERATRRVILVAHNRGAGVLEFTFEQGTTRRVIGGCALAYPQQGQMMRAAGAPSRDDLRAKQLNEALDDFNALLQDWCT